MRTLILASALTVALSGTAFAQMCGGALKHQSTTAQIGGMGGMSCMDSMKQAADDPMADKPASKPMMGGMMCPCCKNMASMGGMKPEGGATEKHKHEMPMQTK
jgi:hypothetical protein